MENKKQTEKPKNKRKREKMKKISSFIWALIAMIFSIVTQPVLADGDEYSMAPVVPGNVILDGRQAVTDYLLKQVDHVEVRFTGRSIIGYSGSYLSARQLKDLGYMHRGSFTELSDAIARIPFSQQVVTSPDGYYDVRVDIKLWTVDNRIALEGRGYLNIQVGKGGELTAEDFNPYVQIPQILAIHIDDPITTAKWLSPDGRNDQELVVSHTADEGGEVMSHNSHIFLPITALEIGYLVIAGPYGQLEAVDLKNRTSVESGKVIAILGDLSSSDVVSLKNPTTLSGVWKDRSFYKNDGKVYGRFPLIDIVTSSGMKEVIYPSIPVWGSDLAVIPQRIIVNILWLDPVKPGVPAAEPVSKEYELPFSGDAGGWMLNLPAGGYHIEVDFNVLDWEQDPNPGKG